MDHDFLIIGGGIAGLALGAELALDGATLVLEAEPMPGMHSSGRSAALYTPNFGAPLVCALNRASEAVLLGRDREGTAPSFMSPRGALTVAAPGDEAALTALAALSTPAHPVHSLSASEALALAPLLRPERVAAACHEPGVMDIDVDALQGACLERLRARDGRLRCGERVTRCERVDGGWRVESTGLSTTARTVVNAAGAWASSLGALAGAVDVALEPRRRTAIVVDAPPGTDVARLPVVGFADNDAYFKPEAGRIMASLGDQVPMHAHDAQPDDMDVAMTVDWLEGATSVDVRATPHAWAGLRTFAPDECPVVGFDPRAPGFFWLAGQGGYGIMMAPSLARAARGLIVDGRLPEDLVEAGITEAALAPGRPGIAA